MACVRVGLSSGVKLGKKVPGDDATARPFSSILMPIHAACARVVGHHAAATAGAQRLVVQVSPSHYFIHGMTIWLRLRGLRLHSTSMHGVSLSTALDAALQTTCADCLLYTSPSPRD